MADRKPVQNDHERAKLQQSLRKLPFVSVRFMVGLCDVMTAFLTCLNSTQSDHSVSEKNA